MTPFILEYLLKVTVAIGLAALIEWLWRSASAARRHLLWTMTFLLILLLPFGWLLPSLYTIEVTPTMVSQADWERSDAAVNQSGVAAAAHEKLEKSSGSLTSWLAWLWLAGVVAGVGRLLIGLGRLMAIRLSARPVREETIVRLWHEIEGRGRLWMSTATNVPFTAGWPGFIILPASATEWDRDTCRAVLIHEQAHLARQDWLIRMGAEMVGVLLWFHPLVWWAAGRLRLAQEEACDDTVLTSRISAIRYAETLAQQAREGSSGRLALAMAQPSTLRRRVQALLDANRTRHPAGPREWAWSGLLMMLVLGSAGLTRAETREAAAAGKEVTVMMEFICLEGSEAAFEKLGLEDAATHFSEETLAELPAGIDLLSAPTVVTHEGKEATIQIGRDVQLGDGESAMVGLAIDALPEVKPSGVVVKVAARRSWLKGSELMSREMPEVSKPMDPLHYRACGMMKESETGRIWWFLGRARVLPGIEAIEEQLREIILPRVDFQAVPLGDVVTFLEQTAIEEDGSKKGVDLFLAGSGEEPEITLSLVNMPLGEALRYVAQLSGYEMEVTVAGVVLRPAKSEDE